MQLSFSNRYNYSSLEGGGINIQLTNAGKRFNREWIFRHMNYIFQQGRSYAITGPNGSGKSTLLQTIAGAIAPSEGTVQYQIMNKEQGTLPASRQVEHLELGIAEKDKGQETGNLELQISDEKKQATIPQSKKQNRKPQTENWQLASENIFNHIAIVAPYLEVIEEMTATEFLRFHASFKPLLSTISIDEILEIIGLKTAEHKQIRFFSSGMKQRIKLAQAIFSDVAILLLDEPCTNLDASGYNLYHQLVNDYCKERLLIVSSNDINEYNFCEEKLSILDYK